MGTLQPKKIPTINDPISTGTALHKAGKLMNTEYNLQHLCIHGIRSPLWPRLSLKERKYHIVLRYMVLKCTYSTCRPEMVPKEVGMFPLMLFPLKFLLHTKGSYFRQAK
jgi:hypothetical protein